MKVEGGRDRKKVEGEGRKEEDPFIIGLAEEEEEEGLLTNNE